MYAFDPVDEIQSHMLGVIAGLMTSYSLNPAHVEARFEYIMSLAPNDVTNTYITADEPIVGPETPILEIKDLSPVFAGCSWANYNTDDDDFICYQDSNQETTSEHSLDTHYSETSDIGDNQESDGPAYVCNRREFCAIMHKK